jgi:hypothetical protein
VAFLCVVCLFVCLLDLVWSDETFEETSGVLYDNDYCSFLLFPGNQRIASIV